jgi:hypothetical protein
MRGQWRAPMRLLSARPGRAGHAPPGAGAVPAGAAPAAQRRRFQGVPSGVGKASAVSRPAARVGPVCRPVLAPLEGTPRRSPYRLASGRDAAFHCLCVSIGPSYEPDPHARGLAAVHVENQSKSQAAAYVSARVGAIELPIPAVLFDLKAATPPPLPPHRGATVVSVRLSLQKPLVLRERGAPAY